MLNLDWNLCQWGSWMVLNKCVKLEDEEKEETVFLSIHTENLETKLRSNSDIIIEGNCKQITIFLR